MTSALKGIAWEEKGIKPEMEFRVFDPTNPMSGHMLAINKLIEIIDLDHEQI